MKLTGLRLVNEIVAAVVVLMALTVANAGAEEVYRWTDSAGKIHYGSKPPKGVKPAAVKGPKISRYSSEKSLKSLRKTISDANLATNSKPTPPPPASTVSTEKTARASMVADTPGKSDIQETNLVKGELITKNLKTNYDTEGRLNSCTVEITNQSSIPIANFAINFEFPDGTIVPGNGPELIDPGATVTYELSRAVLPLAFGAVGDTNPQPKVNISYF